MNVFVTGATGYIGGAVAARLAHQGHQVFGLTRQPEQARALFAGRLQHCRPVVLEDWIRSQRLLQRLKQHWAYFLLVRIDPYVARRQWRALPD